MRKVLFVLSALVVGAGLGAWATEFIVRSVALGGMVSSGPWRTSVDLGSADAGPYLRTALAEGGLLALNKSETLYYLAETDSAGDPMDGRCHYTVRGTDPATRWWSITVYGDDHYLVPNAAKLYSLAKTTVARADDGSFVIHVSPEKTGENWIPTGGAPNISLTARLYNPAPQTYADPGAAVMPVIEKAGCPS